jgi:hypothetical protein
MPLLMMLSIIIFFLLFPIARLTNYCWNESRLGKVRFDGIYFRIKGEKVAPEQIIAIDGCEIDPPVGGVCRRVRLPNGACCETNDLKAIALLEQSVGWNRGMRLVSLLENRRWIVV